MKNGLMVNTNKIHIRIMKTREELITGIRDIIRALGVEEFDWSNLGLDWTPFLENDRFDDNFSFYLTSFDVDGVYSCSCCDIKFCEWDEVPIEFMEEIYNAMSEYKGGEKNIKTLELTIMQVILLRETIDSRIKELKYDADEFDALDLSRLIEIRNKLTEIIRK